jgi:hypothetical protein
MGKGGGHCPVPIVNFKVKEAGVRWEDLQVFRSGNYPEDGVPKIRRYARDLANRFGREVRWNWLLSKQGHYVSPTKKKETE